MLAASGCLASPDPSSQRALYLDLRKIVESHEEAGWTRDQIRLHAGLEPALRSLCQVDPSSRSGLDAWLTARLGEQGGTPEELYRANGGSFNAAAREALSLTRTRALLRYTEERAKECPFWLTSKPHFDGQQYDTGRFFVLAETSAFGSVIMPDVPALGGGGRLMLGHGLNSQLSLALGFDLAALGTLVARNGQGIDATATIATPLQLRLSRLSTIYDFALAPVMSFETGRDAWPPGVRAEIGVGSTSLRATHSMNYSVIHLAYDLHPGKKKVDAQHTFHLGFRIGIDWAP